MASERKRELRRRRHRRKQAVKARKPEQARTTSRK